MELFSVFYLEQQTILYQEWTLVLCEDDEPYPVGSALEVNNSDARDRMYPCITKSHISYI